MIKIFNKLRGRVDVNKENQDDHTELSMNSKTLFSKFLSAGETLGAFVYNRRCFLFAFFAAVLFYFPSLKGGSDDAGILYMGDTLGFYLPALAKTHQLIHYLNFSAIDFSLFNGSSEFFLSPNFFAVHPLVVIFCLVFSPESTTFLDYGRFVMIIIALHSFFACYFTIKLFTRFFSFDFVTAVLIAVLFAFNINMVRATGQIAFIFSITIIPWVAYGALSFQKNTDFRHLLFGSLPVMFGLLGGYIPLGVAGLVLSIFIVGVRLFLIEDTSTPSGERMSSFIISMLPLSLASIVVGPYLFSVLEFNQTTISHGRPTLFYSAHQMAEIPQTLLRFFSPHFPVPGPFYEFSIVCGFPAIIVIALFFFSPGMISKVSTREWKILKTSLAVYLITVLAIFGNYSVVSDLIYYLVPSVGGMHIYQRFLLPAHLFFAIAIALMFRTVVLNRPVTALKIVMAIFFAATTVMAYIVAFNHEWAMQVGMNNYLVFELFLGFLFSCALTVTGRKFVYTVAIILFCLPALDLMNERSHGQNTYAKQREIKKIALDENERARLTAWIKQFSDKAVIKYVDITPKYKHRIYGAETFPKDFPRMVLEDLNLSSYGGHNYYLSARGDYIHRMPVAGENIILNPDWDLVFDTGVDFIIAPWSGGMLQSLLPPESLKNVYRLPYDVAMVPVPPKPFNGVAPLFDNGFFRVFSAFSEYENFNGKRFNIAAGKAVKQSSTMGVYAARLAVDGNINGDFANGSVTHTDQDVNAWFEIDLGGTESIDAITIWNRTDGASDRLSNYWVFISDTPFNPYETASVLKTRPDIHKFHVKEAKARKIIKSAGTRGRYVRIQFAGDQPASNSYLSLAEVEIFRMTDGPDAISAPVPLDLSMVHIHRFETNYANRLLLDLEVKQPAAVQYLFWYNPRLQFFLNDRPIIVKRVDGLTFIDIPAGRHVIEIKYIHGPLKVFWLVYLVYGLAFIWVVFPGVIRGHIVNWIRSWR